MVDMFSASKRKEIMSRIRSKNTKPEILVRKELYLRGWHYRLYVQKLPGKPDIVFARWKTVIQIRGCFWHGHVCQRNRMPKTNQSYWLNKIERNKVRDKKNGRKLRSMGWSSIVVWECRCKTKHGLEREVRRIERILGRKMDTVAIQGV